MVSIGLSMSSRRTRFAVAFAPSSRGRSNLVPINTHVDAADYNQALNLILNAVAVPAASIAVGSQLPELAALFNQTSDFIKHALEQYNKFLTARLIPIKKIKVKPDQILVNEVDRTTNVLNALNYLQDISGKGNDDSTQSSSLGGHSFAGPEQLREDLIEVKLQVLYKMNLSELPEATRTALREAGILLKPMNRFEAAHAVFNILRTGTQNDG